MAAALSSPPLNFDTKEKENAEEAEVVSPDVRSDGRHTTQQDGLSDDSTGGSDSRNGSQDAAPVVSTTKRHVASPSPRRPEDNNQYEESDDSLSKTEQEPSVSIPSDQSAPLAVRSSSTSASCSREQQPHQQQHQHQHQQPHHDHTREQTPAPAAPAVASETLELARLKRENEVLAQRLKDLSVQYGRHVHSLQTQLQQQSATHERAEKDWTRETAELQRARAEAVDGARRARAQVQVLEERLARVESLPLDESSTNTNSSRSSTTAHRHSAALPQQSLRLTQQQSYLSASSYQHPHTVHRSVVSAPRSDAPHVTCHTPSARNAAYTVRATRIGRSSAAPAGTEPQSLTASVPPLVNPFHWSASSGGRAGYSSYSTPPPTPAPTPVRSLAYCPTPSYPGNTNTSTHANSSVQYQHSPVGYQPPLSQPQQQQPQPQRQHAVAPESTTSISIYMVSDSVANAAAAATGQPHVPPEPVKPSSGLLAYCSELLTSSRAAPSALASAAPPSAVSSPLSNAKVAPAWSLFCSAAAPAKQTSLDVEQGYSPPRPHLVSHEQLQEQEPGTFMDMAYCASAPQLHPRQANAATASPPRPAGCSSVLPMHSC